MDKNMQFFKRILLLGSSVALIFICAVCTNIYGPGELVPPTVDQDPSLPQMKINVAGHDRLIHYRTFGDSSNPVFFIMHGSLSDMRAYLPLQLFSDKYYVVFWDQRGSGLSERVTKEELSFDAMVEEIDVLKAHFSPNDPITIMGHSWSAVFVALYIGEHPESVHQAIMVEPFGLKSEFMKAVSVPLNFIKEGYLDMVYSSDILTPKDHESLDYKMLAMLRSAVRNYFCDPNNLPLWPVWRVGGYALVVWENSILKGTKYDYDFTENLSTFPRKVLFVGSTCSPIGYEFQRDYNATVFEDADVLEIENSGHRILTEQFDPFVAGLKDYLDQY